MAAKRMKKSRELAKLRSEFDEMFNVGMCVDAEGVVGELGSLSERNEETEKLETEKKFELPVKDREAVNETETLNETLDTIVYVQDDLVHSDNENEEVIVNEYFSDSDDDGHDNKNSSDEDEREELTPNSLGALCVDYNVTQAFGTALLHLLHRHPAFKDWPLDIRTILKPGRNKVEVEDMPPGIYHHFGLHESVTKFCEQRGVDGNVIKIQLNVDGLPISKSSSQFWPILGRLFNVPGKPSFIIGIYHGYRQPENFNQLLEKTVNDLEDVTTNGINLRKGHFGFKLNSVICDAPAKAKVMNVMGHSACNSCTKCYLRGKKINGRVCFAPCTEKSRTHEEFIAKLDDSFHHGDCEIARLENTDIIKVFKIDYMHNVCLGIVKNLIKDQWMDSQNLNRLEKLSLTKISNSLEQWKSVWPLEFARRPRGLDLVSTWKATEFRSFLLYSGPVVLEEVFENRIGAAEFYSNFISLHIAISILVSPRLIKDIDYAEMLLRHFVETFTDLYGRDRAVYNFHAILHLIEDAREEGVVDNFSAFWAESHLGRLKKLANRKSERPLQQVVRRLAEKKNFKETWSDPEKHKGEVLSESMTLPEGTILPNGCEMPIYFRFKCADFEINCQRNGQNILVMKNGDVIMAFFFCFQKRRGKRSLIIVGKKYQERSDLYLFSRPPLRPCPSSDLNICKVKNLSKNLEYWYFPSVLGKGMSLPMADGIWHAAFPLLHNESF